MVVAASPRGSVSFSQIGRSRTSASEAGRAPAMGATATTADHIRRAVQSPKERPTLSDLEGMSSRFEPFYEELEQGVAEVHEGQESRLAAIEGWLERVQRSLVTEQQRRLEMFRLVESNLQAQFDSMSSTWRVRPTALLLNRSST